MIRVRCPICARSIEGGTLSELPHFPFCSERCRLVDLNRWVEGEYTISRPADPSDHEELEAGEDDAEDY
jgi:endogenous inhibitor of DNA gyrase (YacG/DUF329 family)